MEPIELKHDIISIIEVVRKNFDISDNLKAYVIDDYEMKTLYDKVDFENQSDISICKINVPDKTLDFLHSVGTLTKKSGVLVCIASPMFEEDIYILFTNDMKNAEKEFIEAYLKTTEESLIKPGTYEISTEMGKPMLVSVSINNVTKPVLNDDLFKNLQLELVQFYAKEDVYKAFNIDFKRGILLYGPPGTGKTSLIKHFLSQLKDAVGIIAEANKESHISYIKRLINNERLNNVRKIVVFEDIDGTDDYKRSLILNMLDGVETAHNVVFIATTNFPKNLDVALTNRPSRFDSFYKIDLPNENSRRALLEMYFKNLKSEEVESLVKDTKDFNGAYFKEIFLVTKLYDMTPTEAVKTIKTKMKDFEEFQTEKKRGNYFG